MKNKQTILHLSLIDGIGPVTIKKLAQKNPKDFLLSDLYALTAGDIVHQFGVSKKTAQKIVSGLQDKAVLERELTLIEKHQISFVTFGFDDYPHLLAEIYAPPPVLYFKGTLIPDEKKTIAVIGSRKAHRYGQQVIAHFVPQLVCQDWTIVSGGAIGADSMAHQETVDSGGRTVVVLGSGLLRPYPASNRRLFDSVLQKGGALISSFSLETQAMPGNFPARNRIIAGLSRGCLVVQAAKKSGARITAQFALEQGREVFAVPGPIDDQLSLGCHALIQQGAKLTGSVEDILVEFSDQLQKAKPGPAIVQQAVISFQNESIVPKVAQKPPLEGIQGQVWLACKSAISVDDLTHKVGLEPHQMHALLFELQLEGHIKQNFAGLWERG